MACLEIKDLFYLQRFPTGWHFLLTILFFPFGFLLGFVRIFLSLHTLLISSILPKMSVARQLVVRSMCGVLGIVVRLDGMEHRDPTVKIVISNHISALDHLAVELLIPNIAASSRHVPSLIRWALSYKDLGASINKDVFISNCRKHFSESNIPILIHPEGASTNGKKGLLKFSSWPFSIGEPVQPMLINIKRPSIAQISPSVLGSQWLSDFFWTLFVPVSYYKLRLLPVQHREETESIEEFTHRVQELLAKELGLEKTSFSSADKAEYLKKHTFQQPNDIRLSHNTIVVSATSGQSISPVSIPENINSSSLHNSSTPPHLAKMADQVKEVLPEVPIHIIQNDLSETRCVDTTITNILEGKILYSHEFNRDSSPGNSPHVKEESVNTPNVYSEKTLKPPVSVTSFGKTPIQRMLSYQDRKIVMIENARKRYIEKNGLS